ncbi:hypothetical protein SAMN04488027_1292 [Psychroflexus sediminis]|uniref:Uncharacterized protein n=1 Tax=Psychroflexus sediminis TaxID=470826 RepID=A0A1G7ZK97_9FLAO|nr:hypothetical protein SAMN04488027_1292 [Psychroflexus sediminis]
MRDSLLWNNCFQIFNKEASDTGASLFVTIVQWKIVHCIALNCQGPQKKRIKNQETNFGSLGHFTNYLFHTLSFIAVEVERVISAYFTTEI